MWTPERVGAICISMLISRSCSTAARAADAAVADIGRGLAVEFLVGVIDRVLQHGGHAAVVLRGDEDEAVELGHLLAPAPGGLVFRRRIDRRASLVEERHRIVAQVDELKSRSLRAAAMSWIHFAGLSPKRPLASGRDDDADVWLAHDGSPYRGLQKRPALI